MANGLDRCIAEHKKKKEVWFCCLAQPPAPCEGDPFEALVAFSFRKLPVNTTEALWPLLAARTDCHALFSNPWTSVFCFGNRYAGGQLQDKHPRGPVCTKPPMGTVLFLVLFTTEGLSVFLISPLVLSLNTVFVLLCASGLLRPGRSCALQPRWTCAWRGAAERPQIPRKRSNLWVAELPYSRHWEWVEKPVG